MLVICDRVKKIIKNGGKSMHQKSKLTIICAAVILAITIQVKAVSFAMNEMSFNKEYVSYRFTVIPQSIKKQEVMLSTYFEDLAKPT